MRRIPAILFIVVCVVFIAESVLLGIRVYRGVKLAENAKAFSVRPIQARKHLLIVGDSTGVGIGARSGSESIAGLIAREYPYAEIRNLSRSGAKAGDILDQIRTVQDADFDLVLVQAGWDDTVRFTGLDDMKTSYLEILHTAASMSPGVLFIGPGNMGLAPAFFPPVSWIYTQRSRDVRSLFILLSRETGAQYVDLFMERPDDSLLKNNDTFSASDKLHPSGSGYALWYRELKEQTSLADTFTRK